MAMGPGKRKRGDRSYSHDEGVPRPSPHRPGLMQLAHQNRDQEFRHGQGGYHGNRRPGRGGRGGRGGMGPRRDVSHAESPTGAPTSTRVPPGSSAFTGLVPVQPAAEDTGTTEPQSPQPEPAPVEGNSVTSSTTPDPIITYVWDYVTDERMTSWTESGRQTVIDAGVQARFDEDAIALGILFQELLQAGVTNRLEAADAGSVVKEIIGNNLISTEASNPSDAVQSSFDARLLFLDVLSIVTENDAPPALRPLIIATGIEPKYLRQYLEAPLLEALGLIRSTFGRMSIRKTTNLLYRQSNYNLLREEAEGYSKLMTELFTTSNNEPPTAEVVQETFERIKALIGAFDLDVGRVLDVVLDVFASVLVKQNQFYVKLLRISSWWPKSAQLPGMPSKSQEVGTLPAWALPGAVHWQTNEQEKAMIKEQKEQRDRIFWGRVAEVGIRAFFELGRHCVPEDHVVKPSEDDIGSETEFNLEWIRATGTLPPSGNRVAAQLLGFKLRFYASTVRDPNDVLPVNIIYLAALLIKIGFISLADLYPHVWPPDEKMASVRDEKMKEKAERDRLSRPGGGAANALMMAGALPDDTLPAPPRAREPDASRAAAASKVDAPPEKTADPTSADEKEKLPEPSDQKVLLLKSLLCIGAVPESLFILSRFPWLPDAFPEVTEYLHRIMHQSLSRIYEPLRPLIERESLREAKKVLDPDPAASGKSPPRLADVAPRKTLRWALPDKDDNSDGTDFRFYWDDWADSIPICQSIDDVFLLCRTLGAFSGVKIGTDPGLLIKLVRIGKQSLADDPSAQNMERWVDLSKRLLVPALTLTRRNPGVVNEVYDLLKNFSTATRYSIYAEWHSGSVSRLPDIKSAFDLARAETKDVLKRISKTNIKPMARALAKVAYASPGIVFVVAIGQIEAYDNLVEVVVECARYFTFLGYDVLTWALLTAFGGRGRNRVQADGMLTSKWLAALSLFAGRVFKRYSSLMNPTPILQYVVHQLKKGNTVDLIVLKEMITSMAGIIPDTNFNDSQIVAMAGGELLRQQTLLQLLDKRHESRTTAKRFIRSMTEPLLAGQLLICIAQERQTCVFGLPEADAHVKLLGNLADEVHRVLSQYIDFLRSNLSPPEFDSLIPDVAELIADFGIDPNIAFWISRPTITYRMTEYDKAQAKETQQETTRPPLLANSDVDKDVKMVDADFENTSSQEKKVNDTIADSSALIEITNGAAEVQDLSSSAEVLGGALSTELPSAREPWHPVLSSLIHNLQRALPDDTWTNLSPAFYATFWQLSLYDIQVPTKSYEEEVTRLKNKWMAVKDDRSDLSVAGGAKKEREKKQLTEIQDRLRDELKGHIQAFSRTKNRFFKEKDHWFAGFWGKWDDLNDAIIEHCLVPRLLVSPADALFSFKMLKLLHSAGTANFRTMGLIDHLLREGRLSNLIFVCSAREAENLGRFLNELLKELSRWHAEKAVYEKEAFGVKKDLPGFAKKLVKDKMPETLLEYEDFRRLLYKWHKNINSALKACLTGGEYMHIRNAIIILKALHLYFPAVNWIGRDQVTSVTELSKSEKREDLKIAATSLLGNLKRREKQWMLPQAFNLIESAVHVGSSTPTGVGASKVQQKATPPVNAKTPASQSRSQPDTNGSVSGQGERRKHEVEDGEIDDARVKRARLMETTSALEEKIRSVSQPSRVTSAAVSRGMSTPQADTSSRTAISANPVNTVPKLDALPTSSETRDGHHMSPQSQPSSYGGPMRPDSSRNISATPPLSQVQHSLPKRPDNLPPPLSRSAEWRAPEQSSSGDRRGVRDVRDGRLTELGRSERVAEHPRDYNASSGSQRPDRPQNRPAASERSRNEFNWADEKEASLHTSQTERFGPTLTRDGRPTSINGEWAGPPLRERPAAIEAGNQMRTPDIGPSARSSAMPPPRAAVSAHLDRASQAANDPDRWERGSQVRNDRRERPSRPSSPPLTDERRILGSDNRFEARREEHTMMSERRPSAEQETVRNRHEAGHPPTGPRGDRPARVSGPEHSTSFERSRDLFLQNSLAAPQPVDLNHGRLNQDQGFAPRQDPNYGRLNSVPDVPSGPRRNLTGRAPRTTSALQPTASGRALELDARSQVPPQSLQERSLPTGPSLGRANHRSSSVQYEYSYSGTSSAPPTPVAESVPNDLAGVHPDRLKSLQRVSDSPGYGRTMLPQNEAGPPASNAYGDLHGAALSSGPRGPHQLPPSPVGPPSAARLPPPGPTSVGDRSRGDKRFAGLQTVLQQANSPSGNSERSERGTSTRPRGSRSNGISGPPPHSGPPTPVNGRHDFMFGRPNGPINAVDDESRSGSRDERTQDDSREGEELRSRSGRYQTSRSQSHDRGEHGNSRREHERILRRDEHREHREPRGGGGGNGRDDRDNRRGREDGRRDRERREVREPRVMDDGPGNGNGNGPLWGSTGGGGGERRSSERGGGGGGSGRDRDRDRDRPDRERDRENGGDTRDHHQHHRESSSRREVIGRKRGRASAADEGDVMINEHRGGNGGGQGGNGGGGGGGQHYHSDKRMRRHP